VTRRGVLVALAAVAAALLLETTPAAAAPLATGSQAACADPCGISVLRQGSGRVTSVPEGIDCGGDCQAPFIFEQVELRATPTPRGWVGCDRTEPDGACVVYVSTWLCVTAVFDPGAPVPDQGMCGPPIGGGGGGGPGGGTIDPYVSWAARCTVRGTRRGDVLRGTVVEDVICGLGGDDRIYGFGGNDLLRGGAGNDRLYGQGDRDRLDGGPGNDMLAGGTGEDEHRAGAGADSLVARDGMQDLLEGGTGRDRARTDVLDVIRAVERRF
jgi:RTX calcium-binding nonapeptide repeat (4 copies)